MSTNEPAVSDLTTAPLSSQSESFCDVFAMIQSYLCLLTDLSDRAPPSPGLIKLYSYRTGTLEFDTQLLEQKYINLMTTAPTTTAVRLLQRFAQSAISYNLTTLYRLLTSTLVTDITRGFGDDGALSPQMVLSLATFAKSSSGLSRPREDIESDLSALVQILAYPPVRMHSPVSASRAILRSIDMFDRIVNTLRFHDVWERRIFLTQLVRVIFYIGCHYYHFDIVRFYNDMVHHKHDSRLKITDLTLAAVPFDPTLIYACADDTSSVSRWGVCYVQRLESVLMPLGGVKYAATLSVEAPGHKGAPYV